MPWVDLKRGIAYYSPMVSLKDWSLLGEAEESLTSASLDSLKLRVEIEDLGYAFPLTGLTDVACQQIALLIG